MFRVIHKEEMPTLMEPNPREISLSNSGLFNPIFTKPYGV